MVPRSFPGQTTAEPVSQRARGKIALQRLKGSLLAFIIALRVVPSSYSPSPFLVPNSLSHVGRAWIAPNEPESMPNKTPPQAKKKAQNMRKGVTSFHLPSIVAYWIDNPCLRLWRTVRSSKSCSSKVCTSPEQNVCTALKPEAGHEPLTHVRCVPRVTPCWQSPQSPQACPSKAWGSPLIPLNSFLETPLPLD